MPALHSAAWNAFMAKYACIVALVCRNFVFDVFPTVARNVTANKRARKRFK